MSETFLNSSVTNNEQDLYLPGYKLVRADHPSDTKRGGVCCYFKECLPIRIVNTSYLQECLLLEVVWKKTHKRILVSVVYRSPSQNREEFENFLLKFEKLLDDVRDQKPFLSVILGDFNARSKSWYNGDIDTVEGTNILSLTSSSGFHQIIKEPTHLLNQSSSCIDLIFTDQPNLLVDIGVHPSLYDSCHHQIIHSKFNLKIEYPLHHTSD